MELDHGRFGECGISTIYKRKLNIKKIMIMIMIMMIMIIIVMIKKNLHSVLKLEFSSLLSAPLAGIKIIIRA